MVVKKYLCNAPKIESWDEKAEALLKSLNNDKIKLEQVARQTLSILKERRKNEKKRIGPGRKSNAEHAMDFYEYLLRQNYGGKPRTNSDNVDDDDDDDDDDDNNDNNQDNDGDDDNDDDQLETSTESGGKDGGNSFNRNVVDTQQDLLKQEREDACNVCLRRISDNDNDNDSDNDNDDVIIIRCTTCSRIFHKECLRPVTKTIHSDWSCPYCITQGKRGYKRHSKTWRRAENGVRQMKRMRIEIEKEKETGNKEMKEDNAINDVKNNETTKVFADSQDTKNTPSSFAILKGHPNDYNVPEDCKFVNSKEIDDSGAESTKSIESLVQKDSNLVEGTDEGKQNSDKTLTMMKAATKVESATKDNDSYSFITASATSFDDNDNDASKRRKNLALYKIADSYTPNSTESLLVSGRRSRKQPALYQPQLCADSRWQSDEKIEGIESDESDGDGNDGNSDVRNSDICDDKREGHNLNVDRVSDDKSKKENENDTGTDQHVLDTAKNEDGKCVLSIAESNDEKKPGSIWCNFCHDDPQIEICVFCGCRRCFGKHDKTSLLLCDNCDEEYHTYCLGLSTVPPEQRWYCPNCEKLKELTNNSLEFPRKPRSVKSDSSDLSACNSPNTKQKSNFVTIMIKSEQTVDDTSQKPPATAAATKITAEGKRRRGRPPKNKDKTTDSTLRKQERAPKSNNAVPGKKRGRPPKSSNPTTIESKPRKRGRPPKVKTEPNPSSIPCEDEVAMMRKRPKPVATFIHDMTDTSVATQSSTSKDQEIITVSRSGRTVKRASFHDEIEEGEQHLSSKLVSTKPQECSMNRTKIICESNPRKKSKIEKKKEGVTNIRIVADTTDHSELKCTGTNLGVIPNTKGKKDEIMDQPPVAPVRMKTVVQPPDSALWQPLLHSDPSNVKAEPERSKKEANEVADTNSRDQKIVRFVSANSASIGSLPSATSNAQRIPLLLPPDNESGVIQKAAPGSKMIDPKSSYPRPQGLKTHEVHRTTSTISSYPSTPILDTVALQAAVKALPASKDDKADGFHFKNPRRKPGARECMQIVRRFGVDLIPENYMNVLLDYCRRGKVEHLIRMRERLDRHSRFLECQLAGLEVLVNDVGESNISVPTMNFNEKRAASAATGGIVVQASSIPQSSNTSEAAAVACSAVPVELQNSKSNL